MVEMEKAKTEPTSTTACHSVMAPLALVSNEKLEPTLAVVFVVVSPLTPSEKLNDVGVTAVKLVKLTPRGAESVIDPVTLSLVVYGKLTLVKLFPV
jgi:hypothetical protein